MEPSLLILPLASRSAVCFYLFSCSRLTGWLRLRQTKIFFRACFVSFAIAAICSFPASAQSPTPAIELSWTANLGRLSQSSPAADLDGIVYITTTDGKLFAVNPDGAVRWEFTFGFETASTPAIGLAGTIYFGCRDRQIYAVDSTGHLKWRFKTDNWVDASPTLGADETIYVGSWDKKFYALESDGRLKWTFATDAPITSSAAIDAEGTIYFGGHDHHLYALRPDGTQKWKFSTGGAILSSPALGDDGAIYFTSTDGHLYTLNADGSLRWKMHTGGINPASPVLSANGTIFLGVNTNHCEIEPPGKKLWSRYLSPNGYRASDWLVASPVALADGNVVTAGTDLHLCIFERGGRGVWHESLGSGIYASPLLLADGTLYCAPALGGLRCYKNFPPPATSSWPMFRGNPQRTGRIATKQ